MRTTRGGFVLAGGRSSRMGRDKALLEIDHSTLVERIAGRVLQAAGNVMLIGPPERYARLGIPTIADRVEGCGPLGGLLTALTITPADWNLLVACDLPDATAELFEELFEAAESSEASALVPATGEALEPLCAVYHRRLQPAAEAAIRDKRFKMQEFVSSIDARVWPAPRPALFHNVNTPQDWTR